MNTVMHRQGDVMLKPVSDLPKDKTVLEDKVLAYGEMTGHSHRFADPSFIERYQGSDGLLYLEVLQDAELIHEEHHHQIIEKGIYQQIQEREFDYYDEALKKVVD